MADYLKMFKANPSALLGDSWGAVQSAPIPASPADLTAPSSIAQSTNSDSEYEDITDEDEDTPLQISSWGTNATPSTPSNDWKGLADPNFKPKAGGIGSGNLHRRGANFKPVDESLILNQRLNSHGKTSGKSKTAKSKLTHVHVPSVKHFHPKSQKPLEIRIPRIPTRARSSLNHTGNNAGGWGTGQLSAQPFWQQTTPIPPQPPATSRPFSQQHHQYNAAPPPMSAPATRIIPPVSLAIKEEPPAPAKTQLLQINLELAPGMSASLSVFQGDEPSTLVERFAKDHKITMTDAAKKSFAQTLSKLVEAKLRQA